MTFRLVFPKAYFARELALSAWVEQEREKTLFGEREKPSFSHLIALDEVGRGCVAGPVVVCASLWSFVDAPKQNSRRVPEQLAEAIKDSKKLSERKREVLYGQLIEFGLELRDGSESGLLGKEVATPIRPFLHMRADHSAAIHAPCCPQAKTMSLLSCFLARASVNEIEALNIWGATQLAIQRSLVAILSAHSNEVDPNQAIVVFDGNLPANVPQPYANSPFVTLTKGDSLLKSVSLSSLLAKVSRDHELKRLDVEYPDYGFSSHKGYGTAAHLQAIQKNGKLSHHRESFLRKSGL